LKTEKDRGKMVGRGGKRGETPETFMQRGQRWEKKLKRMRETRKRWRLFLGGYKSQHQKRKRGLKRKA